MAIEVFHGKDFRAMTDERFGLGPALNFPEDFHHVATLDIDDAAALTGKAFLLTNSIEHGWWENEGVTAHTDSPAFRTYESAEGHRVTGTRSTSVGDRIRLSDGRVFRCAPVGWEEEVTHVAAK